MSWPKIFRRIFENAGAGPLLLADILPVAGPDNKGAVPAGGQPWQVYGVNADGTYGFMSGSLSGLVSPFSGNLGGPGQKHPIDRRTGQPDLSYALCDGGTYTALDGEAITTPDLRDRFILGAGVAEAGSSGGNASATTSSAAGHTHTQGASGATTLTLAQTPAHQHGSGMADISANAAKTPIYGSVRTGVPGKNTGWVPQMVAATPAIQHLVQSLGSGGSHTHTNPATASAGDHLHTVSTMPSYYALAYIMKL